MIKINIIEQGAPNVNEAYIFCHDENMVALYVDMDSKYCEVSGITEDTDGNPAFFIASNEHSLYLSENDPEQETFISFPEFNDYTVFSCSAARYTIAVCLVKKEVEWNFIQSSLGGSQDG